MSIDLSSLVKMQPIPGIVVNDPVSKKPGLAPFKASAVITETGTTAEAHIADVSIHTPKASIDADINVAVNTVTTNLQNEITVAVNTVTTNLQNNITVAVDTASSALQADIDELETLLNTFLNGAADGGDIDRLKELVAAINANKGSIDALVADKVAKADIINDLTTGGAGKVLSAEQGKALKALIDSLNTDVGNVHTHANLADVLDKLSTANGKLQFNGGEVGETRHWSRIITAVPTEWPADMHPSGIMLLTAARV